MQHSLSWQHRMLGGICYSAARSNESAALVSSVPLLSVAMQPLDELTPMCDVWHSEVPLTQGQCGAINYRCNDEMIFGVIVLAEANFSLDTADSPLQQATASAYQQIGSLLTTLDYPYVFRYWNYMADINGQSHGLERYRQFNLGRQDALLAQGREVVGNVPAACALGMESGALSIAFLAGRVAPVAIENPRQLSAYHYPQSYGPRSPTFSRATLVNLSGSVCLFVSGTASIVGHSTLHPDDVIAQTRETLINMEAVLAEANQRSAHGAFQLADLQFKVYVKHPEHFTQIRAELESRIGTAVQAIYLQADVCRQELLVEIEATAIKRGIAGGG